LTETFIVLITYLYGVYYKNILTFYWFNNWSIWWWSIL